MFAKVGSIAATDSSLNTVRADRSGAIVIAQGHGRYQEPTYRGNVYSAGMTTTSIANATFTTATLGATATPIIGVWNPTASGKNLVILQVRVQGVVTASTATGGGAYVWCTAVNQSGITTGISPLNRFTFATTGAVGKGFANTALTGLSGNLTVQEASGIQPGPSANFSEVGTAVGFVDTPGTVAVEQIDGAWIVQPGGVLAMLCTTTPVAISVASSILWEEVPV